MKCFPDSNNTVRRQKPPFELPIIFFHKGSQIFGRYYVIWYRVSYFRSKTSDASSNVSNLTIGKFNLYLLRTLFLVFLSLNNSCIKYGIRLFRLLHTSVHKRFPRARFVRVQIATIDCRLKKAKGSFLQMFNII